MRSVPIRVPTILCLAAAIGPGVAGARQEAPGSTPLPHVVFETSRGNLTFELDSVHAPRTVANFLELVRAGYYNDLVFHRVIPRKLVQIGIVHAEGNLRGLDRPAIPNEADNRIHHGRGTIAMARNEDPQSATTEFFINLSDNWEFDFKSYEPDEYGFAVFGRVTDGLEVAEEISRLDTRRLGPFRTFPKEMVLVYAAYVVEP